MGGNVANLSKDDYKFFLDFNMDEESKNKLFTDPSVSEEERRAIEANWEALQNADYKQDLLETAERGEKEDLANKITQGLNVALAGADIATSVGQIQSSKAAAKRLRRPTRPTTLTSEPLLQQAIADAQRGNYDTVRALAPAQREILDQYLADLNTAKSVTGGQAGGYGALAQLASTRRGRRTLELVPMADQIRRQNLQRYDELLGMKLAENQAINQSQAQLYPYDLNQYNQDAIAAGELGQYGRSNLRSSMTALGSFLPQAISDLTVKKRFDDIYNSGLVFGKDNAKIMADADVDFHRPDLIGSDYLEQLNQVYGTYA